MCFQQRGLKQLVGDMRLHTLIDPMVVAIYAMLKVKVRIPTSIEFSDGGFNLVEGGLKFESYNDCVDELSRYNKLCQFRIIFSLIHLTSSFPS